MVVSVEEMYSNKLLPSIYNADSYSIDLPEIIVSLFRTFDTLKLENILM